MLFNSYIFICLFLPMTLAIYYFLGHLQRRRLALAALIIASLLFYSYWSFESLLIILSSILINYFFGRWLCNQRSKWILGFGIGINVAILCTFKYVNFFVDNFNIALPLAISFFTFQQIDFLVDTYRGKVEKLNFVEQCLFVTFFPHLIAGPIIRYDIIIPQFRSQKVFSLQHQNLATGLAIFAIGLFKKVIIADGLAAWVSRGYLNPESITFFEAWGATISYAFQLYFDFSGYSEMAIGLAKMFNIDLPINFNSPYKAKTVTEFWRRWHITLSTWFNEHVYAPILTSLRHFGTLAIGFSLMFTFFLMGMWHGASWKCIVFGLLNGAFILGEFLTRKVRKKLGARLPLLFTNGFGLIYTFGFWCTALVFFRANSMPDAIQILKGMFLFNGYSLSYNILFPGCTFRYPVLLAIYLFVIFAPSALDFIKLRFSFRWAPAVAVGMMLALSMIYFNRTSAFLYFQF